MLISLVMMAAGLLLAVYGVIFVRVAARRIQAAVESFGYGYVVLGATLLVLGAVSGFGNQTMIEGAIVIAYAALLLGTVLMLRVVFYDNKGYSALAMLLGVVGGVLLWIWFVMQYPPHPTLVDGALRFETDGPVLASLAVVLLGAWVPAGLRVARVVAAKVEWVDYAVHAAVPVAVLVMFSTSASWKTLAVIAAATVAMTVTVRKVRMPEKEA